MKQLITILLLLLMTTPCLMAQRKELSQARTYIKSGKYDDAEKLLNTLLSDSANRRNRRVYLLLYDVLRHKYDQGNEKLYLKQRYDTTAFFANTLKIFATLETIDSLVPDDRARHAAQAHLIRPNLFNGGTFYLHKSNWKEAFRYFETYIDCMRQPLFRDYHYDSTDVRLPEAAYWTVSAGYMMHDPVLTLRHRRLALRDSARADFTLMFVAEARRWLSDDSLYLQTLQEGFRRHPQFSYFFPRLIDFYAGRGQHEKALAVADSALAVDDSNLLFLFAKSSALLRLERYQECIDYSTRIIAVNDTMAEPYFNAGSAYLNLATGLDGKKERRLMKSAYHNALFFMERYRALAPEQKQKWGPALYRIYLNLNMGKQFDEIDHLLKE